ncbi:Endo-1,3-1,4-beta-glycanase EglC [Paramyrothecium foliicola]|nr:Endo-1,3-1,4-beta-glycanase EglC [Paramyrothecium foliicola]
MKPVFFLSVVLLQFRALAALCGSLCDLYTQSWEQLFTSPSLDTTIWNYRTDRKALSAQLAANVGQANGNLVISLKKQQVATYSYTGGGIISKPRFHYGYYEARMKGNAGGGWHSAFWLMAGNGSSTFSTADHTHSEIDIFERDSVTNTTLTSNLNFWRADGSRNGGKVSGTLATAYQFPQWQIFGALWKENWVAFYINGARTANLTFPPSLWTHNYMNIWLTTIAYATTPVDSYLPSTVEASYVRYYQKDYYLTAGSLCFADTLPGAACPSNKDYTETGAWADSSLFGYTLNLATRYSCGTSGATASWRLAGATVTGVFQLWAWIVVYPNSDPAARYTLTRNSVSITNTAVNQTSGDSRWVLLADNIAVSAGDGLSVKLTASGSGCARADTVKFVRTS